MSGTPPDRALGQLSVRLRQLEQRVADLDARVRELEGSGNEFRETLNRLGDALVDTHDRQTIVSAVLETSLLHLQATAGAFYLVVAGRELLRPMTSCGLPEAQPARELAVGEGVAGRAAQTGDVAVWPGPDPAVAGISSSELLPYVRTAVAVPVRVGGRTYGVLALYGRTVSAPFSLADVQTLSALVRQVEPAIENTFLYEEAQRLAITDGLTSLWNRRHFDLRARAELQRAVRFGDPFSIVLLDVDQFKAVNDRYGHQAGDAVLVELAQRFTASVRDVDVVARIGGEEFGLILPSTTLAGAYHVAQRICSAVAERPFDANGVPLAMTVSAGVATWPDDGSTVPGLMAAADAALYRAKAAGRNQVASTRPTADPPGSEPEAGLVQPEGSRR